MDDKTGTPVYGDSRAAVFRNGKYYDANGKEVSMEDAGKTAIPAPTSSKPQVLAPAGGSAQHPTSGSGMVAPTEATGPHVVRPNSPEARRVGVQAPGQPDPKAAARVDAAEQRRFNARQAKLSKIHGKSIEKMVVDAGGTPATGEGARQSNERWLLEHTAD